MFISIFRFTSVYFYFQVYKCLFLIIHIRIAAVEIRAVILIETPKLKTMIFQNLNMDIEFILDQEKLLRVGCHCESDLAMAIYPFK